MEKVSTKVSSKFSETKQEISRQRAIRQEYQQAQKQEQQSFYIYGRRADESKTNHIDIPLGNDSEKPNMLPDDFISEQYIPKQSNNFNANDYDTPTITTQKRKKRKNLILILKIKITQSLLFMNLFNLKQPLMKTTKQALLKN